ncbi:MAG: proteasome assembly chaperone family protein [Conexivisphaera sp.]
MSEVYIREYGRPELRNPTLVEGLPDVGLVGVISSAFLIDQLKLRPYGHVESELLPPVMVLHGAELMHPVRLYASEDGSLVVLTSEIALPVNLLAPLAYAVVDWAIRNRISRIISLNGYPVPNRLEIEKPQVYGVGNGKDAVEYLRKYGVEIVEEGFIAGFYAMLLREAARYRIDGMALLGQSFPRYPDPGASASVVLKLAEMLELKVDVKPLLEKADEIKLSMRDLMKQTEESMSQSHKALEEYLPAMYR